MARFGERKGIMETYKEQLASVRELARVGKPHASADKAALRSVLQRYDAMEAELRRVRYLVDEVDFAIIGSVLGEMAE